jgi:GNAT superfamily N-acetyltransferase
LVDNFDQPMILMPYNPPYYQKLIEDAGFSKGMDVLSFYYDRQMASEFGLEQKLARIVQRVATRTGITIRKIDLRRKKEEFAALKEVYNDAWSQNWGFVPMTERELDALIDDLGQFFDPKLAYFAEYEGELVGFALAIPNFNEVLGKVYPRPGMPELWTLLQAGYHWKVRDIIRGARFPLMGVRKEFRNKGVDMAMVYYLLKALIHETKYDFLDSGWVLETNELVQILDKIGARPYKTHRFYEKVIT